MSHIVRDDPVSIDISGDAASTHHLHEAHHRQHLGRELPGEWERIAFHAHQFNHGCYLWHCLESDRLYAAWQTALTESR
jgi:hypothetical protein